SDWTNPLNVKAYHVYDWSSTSELKSLAGFSRLLLENLYRAPAFMELLYSTGTGGHAVGIWGAEFEGGLVKAVYISDSDDTKTGYARHTVSCSGDRIIVDGYWAPRVNGLTFLYAPQGVGFTVPKNASAEPTETDVTYTLGDKTVVTKKIPLEGDWMKRYLKKHQASELNDDARDSNNNGVSDKDEYLLGTDPDDENSKKLRITGISFDENGRPKIAHEPEGNSAVADITVQGAVSPAGPWETHSDSDTAHHFFRVIVTPK
nr:IdeS/Mac family cysteine endopeptidase [Kiritimatiellia bacterium]